MDLAMHRADKREMNRKGEGETDRAKKERWRQTDGQTAPPGRRERNCRRQDVLSRVSEATRVPSRTAQAQRPPYHWC